VLCTKGDRAFKNDQFLQAISFYSDALSFSPNDEDVLGCRSAVYAKLGMFNESKKDAESLITIIPQKPKVKVVYVIDRGSTIGFSNPTFLPIFQC